MFYSKTGAPEEHEIVLCTVTKVQHHSVFVNVTEYGYSGMIHISEIAPGRIRNIRDYVKEGKVVVCKVLRVNDERKQVDVSLRRVGEAQRREKINEIKHEQKSEKILEYISQQDKIDLKKLYDDVSSKVFEQYDFLFHAFEDVVEKGLKLETLGIEKGLAEELEKEIKLRIKPKEVTIGGTLTLISYSSDGVEFIKKALIAGSKAKPVEITYLGGGKYRIQVVEKDYKKAEPLLKEAINIITKTVKKDGVVNFTRDTK